MSQIPEPSKAEYDILRILWKNGRQTVREVHDELVKTSGWAYTTTKTMMDRMVNKELLKREEFHGINLYEANISRPAGMAKLVEFFADRVLEVDASTVLSMFSANETMSKDEIKELEDLLKDIGEDK